MKPSSVVAASSGLRLLGSCTTATRSTPGCVQAWRPARLAGRAGLAACRPPARRASARNRTALVHSARRSSRRPCRGQARALGSRAGARAGPREAERKSRPMDYRTYASPFSWRYGRAALRSLFSERDPAPAVARRVGGAGGSAERRRTHQRRRRTRRFTRARTSHRHRGGAGDRTRDPPRSDGRDSRLCVASEARRRQDSIWARPRWTSRIRSRRIACAWPSRGWAKASTTCLKAFSEKVRAVRRRRVHGLHALAAGRTDDAGVPARRLRARSADRRCQPALRFRKPDDQGSSRRGRHGGVVRAAARRLGALVRDRSLRARTVRARGARDQHANLPAQARLPVALRVSPGSARRSRSSRPTCACSAAPSSAKSASRSAARKSAVRRCRSSAIRFCANASIRSRGC